MAPRKRIWPHPSASVQLSSSIRAFTCHWSCLAVSSDTGDLQGCLTLCQAWINSRLSPHPDTDFLQGKLLAWDILSSFMGYWTNILLFQSSTGCLRLLLDIWKDTKYSIIVSSHIPVRLKPRSGTWLRTAATTLHFLLILILLYVIKIHGCPLTIKFHKELTTFRLAKHSQFIKTRENTQKIQ